VPIQRAFSTFEVATYESCGIFKFVASRQSRGHFQSVAYPEVCVFKGPCTVYSCIRGVYFIVSMDSGTYSWFHASRRLFQSVAYPDLCVVKRPWTVFRGVYFIVSMDSGYLFMMSRVKAPFSKSCIPRFVRIHEALNSIFMFLRYLLTMSRVNGAMFQVVHNQRCANSVFKWSFKGLASPRCQFKFWLRRYILVKS